jgi:hypothetical protein
VGPPLRCVSAPETYPRYLRSPPTLCTRPSPDCCLEWRNPPLGLERTGANPNASRVEEGGTLSEQREAMGLVSGKHTGCSTIQR